MTIQADLPKPYPTLTEYVLVVGTVKLWDEWVREMIKENPEYIYSISRRVLDTYTEDSKTVYYFVSSSQSDGQITQQLMGRKFHRWYNLGVQVSPEVRCYIRTRCRLTQEKQNEN